jgi:phosphate transport system substrate-binding protein
MKNNLIQLVSALMLLAACESKNHSASGGSSDMQGSISIDGSSTVYPITEAVAEEFKKTAPEVKITIGLSGTGGGFKKFSRGETVMNNASRPIKSMEDSASKVNGITPVELKIAYDGLAVVVSPQNTWCNDITVAELKMLWEPAAQGKIMKWNQIRKNWPNEEVHLFGPGVESGTYDYFTEVIVGKSHSSRGDFTASEDDNVLVQGVKSDKYALGFFGLAYFTENQDKLKLVAVDDGKDDNGKGAVLPTEETVKNKTYAPLGRPLFIYVSGKALERPEFAEFVRFYLENAKLLSKDVGFVALNDEEINLEKKKLQTFLENIAPKL